MSNIGGTATMVGDPPNIIIGTALARHLGFVDFMVHLAPGVMAASIPAVGVIMWVYRDRLTGRIPDYGKVLGVVAAYRVTDWDLMAKSGELWDGGPGRGLAPAVWWRQSCNPPRWFNLTTEPPNTRWITSAVHHLYLSCLCSTPNCDCD